MVNKFRYIFSNKDSNEIEKITYISLKEIEQGRLIDDLKKYTIFSRSIFTGQRDQKNQEIYQDDVFDWASHSRGVIKFVNGNGLYQIKMVFFLFMVIVLMELLLVMLCWIRIC